MRVHLNLTPPVRSTTLQQEKIKKYTYDLQRRYLETQQQMAAASQQQQLQLTTSVRTPSRRRSRNQEY